MIRWIPQTLDEFEAYGLWLRSLPGRLGVRYRPLDMATAAERLDEERALERLWFKAECVGLEREAVAAVVRRFADGAHEYDLADEIAAMVDHDPYSACSCDR